ncbi:restriction endonuclease [Nocardiopsis sp. MT53]|uniref:Restriction endonuclease n=1 Tax=Nocardiopsis changdeensis TaxID=2831969 RepID=A0ABX8BN49_9ACTN|nr:PIN-like domain-containing protein [Nocardiopsis sp. MT53]QUX22477.1 restriction endonuclease [Nocardiopsis changdeensis]QYX38419.1 restriction endonuclease [Nocardiopsis sp. MT53]
MLLDLYRLTPTARNQVLDAFSYAGSRLWVPHQAAIEFSRNRKRVVEERMSAFKQTGRLLKTATTDAAIIIEDAIEKLQGLRDRAGTTREWHPDEAGLRREDILARLNGVMDEAIQEFEALESEHDLHPQDMQRVDSLLLRIDDLLVGKIGSGYSSSELRSYVDEAHSFRFPNKIPPGYLDAGKESNLRAAGDFILWRQTLDRATEVAKKERLILFITKDLKADWWEYDAKGKLKGPRPELVQEMRDTAGADLLLVTLKEFIVGTKEYLSSEVSNETIESLGEFGEDLNSLLPETFRDPGASPNLLDLDRTAFENLIHYLLAHMGYHVEGADVGYRDAGFDFIATSMEDPSRTSIVQTKRHHRPVPVRAIYELIGVLRSRNEDEAIFFATSEFSPSATKIAKAEGIRIVGGSDLIALLANFGINATIDVSPSSVGYFNPDNDARGPWRPSDITSPDFRKENYYPIINPDDKAIYPPTGRAWRFPKIIVEELQAEGRIYWGGKSRRTPRLKSFFSESMFKKGEQR